jgi:ADP-ribose pyrophosphatase YjhB (NUDIX family)
MSVFCPDCGSSLTLKKVEDRTRFFCEECSQVIWQNPKPVAWVLVQKGEEYLLVKRANQPDKDEWDIPGGFLELDESFEEAAVRELKEETGVELNTHKIEVYDTISFSRSENHVVGVVFHTEISEVSKLDARDDAEEAQFWNIEHFEDNSEILREECKTIF